MTELVAIAKITKTRGLRGETVADVLTDFPERFDGLENVTGIMPNGSRRNLIIEKHWFQKSRIILKFKAFDTIEAADTLRDVEICIAEDQAVDLDADEYFDWELEGCRVETLEAVTIGEVKEILRTGGTEVLIIKGETKEYLIPFAQKICIDVDIENKLIRIDPPEGLLEF